MERAEPLTDTVFVVKEKHEHCFLFDGDDLLDLYRALLRSTDREVGEVTREETFDVLEGLVPERLRGI